MKTYSFIIFLSFIFSLEAVKFDPKNELLPSKESCGFQPSGGRLINRQGASVNEYPWMVFVPLKHRIPVPGANLRCAGSLISKRYFIMSRYCLEYYMEKVYLGQHDTSKNITCGEAGCQPVVEVNVDRWFAPDEFEFALVRLARDIEFSDYIQPICLPFQDFPKAQIGETVYSSGWGQMYPGGDYSKVKKKVKETLVANEQCEGAVNDRFLCAKVKIEDITNIPCYGDDGTPVMYQTVKNQFVLEGILPSLRSCVIEEPGRGAKINEEALEFILKFIYA